MLLAKLRVLIPCVMLFFSPLTMASDEFDNNRLSQSVFSDEEITRAILSYLSSPRVGGNELGQQLLSGGTLELWEVGSGKVYFSLPRKIPNQNKVIKTFVKNLSVIRFATDRGQTLHIDQYSLNKTEAKNSVFATTVDNIAFAQDKVVRFPFKGVTYEASVHELARWIRNSTVYGGMMRARRDDSTESRPITFMNHGIMVAKPGEPSLERFVEALLKAVPSGPDSRERKIQGLLDFVTNEIAYDHRDTIYGSEFLKRANETLITRRADCSNTAILMASLLEQTGDEYILVYMPKHIALAVPRGAFPDDNKLGFSYEGRDWQMVETTLKGFKIGETQVAQRTGFDAKEYVQKPSEIDVIKNFRTGSPLSFR